MHYGQGSHVIIYDVLDSVTINTKKVVHENFDLISCLSGLIKL